MNWFDLKDDVAVVIGGTGVLGGALAEGLARAGAAVAVRLRSRRTSCPVHAKWLARSVPRVPVEWLVNRRTESKGSTVGPAVTRQRMGSDGSRYGCWMPR